MKRKKGVLEKRRTRKDKRFLREDTSSYGNEKTKLDKENGPRDIGERTFEYSLTAIGIFRDLQKGDDRAGWKIGNQYLDAATSIGANVQEAQAAESRRDFIHKYGISQKEAKESLYWLKLMKAAKMLPAERLRCPLRETEEIYAVII